MTVIMPTFIVGQPFSASQMNDLSRYLRTVKAISDSIRVPFRQIAVGGTGYIQHAYNRLDYQISGGTATITIGSNVMTGLTGSGTETMTGLTAGQVYAVTTSGTGTIEYLAERLVPSYTTPPTFVDSTILTAANLNNLADSTDDLINLANANPQASFAYVRNDDTSWNREDDTIISIWTGWLRYTGDDADFRISHDAQSVLTSSMKSVFELYVNGTRIVRRLVNDPVPSGWTITSYGGGAHHPGGQRSGEHVTGTADLSSLSLTVGNIYKWEIKQEGTGTSKSMDLQMRVYWLGQARSGASWTDLPSWSEGGVNISAARLNLYRDAINDLHPSAASPSSPMYFDEVVNFVHGASSKRFLMRRSKYLVYRWSGSGRPEIFISPLGLEAGERRGLRAETGTQWVDLDQIGMRYGDRYYTDDIDVAFEVDDVSQL